MFRPEGAVRAVPVVFVALWSATNVSAQFQYYETCQTLPSVSCGSIPIPDFGGGSAELTLTIPANAGSDCAIRGVSASIWIQHTWQGDLLVELISPANTVVTLLNRPGVPQCGGAGFNADNLGGVYVDGCLGGSFLAPMNFDDAPAFPQGLYDPPNVACPGTSFGGGCCACNPSIGSAWYPETPLAAFNGESKVGTWRLRVTDMAGADVGTINYLGLGIETDPLTPPIATIDPPSDFACVCGGGPISGTVDEPDGTLESWELAWSPAAAGPWTVFASGNAPISGVLGNFPILIPDSNVYLRLRATNCAGQTTSFVKVVHADGGFAAASIREPDTGDIVGGAVCIDGTAADYCMQDYRLEYRTAGIGPYNILTTSPSGVQNDPLGTFDTLSLSLADGDYDVRLTGTTICGFVSSHTVTVTVDITAPQATITSPLDCDYVDGVVTITGTASDAHMGGWALYYTGGGASGWVLIASGTTSISGVLANWDTSALASCAYTLRLVASDTAALGCYGIGSNSAEALVSVNVGSDCDVNHDGAADFFDIDPFLQCLFGP